MTIREREMGESFSKWMKNDSMTPGMSWSLDESRQTLSDSLFEQIPNEILLQIFRYLSVADLCNVALVCRLI